jgi:multidrug efflux pump subunit AcrB
VVLVFGVLVLCLIPVLLMFTQRTGAGRRPGHRLPHVQLAADRQPRLPERLHRQFTHLPGFPEYYSSFQINGFNGVQTGIGGLLLKPWNERQRTQMDCCAVQAELDRSGLQIFGFNLPSLPGTGEGLPFQFVINTANDYQLQVAEKVKKRAEESGKFAFLDLDLAFDKPELVVDIDRAKAAQMGVSMQDLGVTLAACSARARSTASPSTGAATR